MEWGICPTPIIRTIAGGVWLDGRGICPTQIAAYRSLVYSEIRADPAVAVAVADRSLTLLHSPRPMDQTTAPLARP